MTAVTRYAGAPGAGKTHALREKLREEAAAGLGVSDFYWLNFTNSGREDVEPEIAEVFPGSDDAEDRAKTLHGLALSLMMSAGEIDSQNLEEQLVVPVTNPEEYSGFDAYAAFCDEQGMTYNPALSDPRRLLDGTKETTHTGNLLFAINDYLTQTCKQPDQWRDAPISMPISGNQVTHLLETWDAFKRHCSD